MTLPSSILTAKANMMVDLLNEGRKPKDMYVPFQTIQYRGLNAFVVINQAGDKLATILDNDGNVPGGWCVNWRGVEK